MAGIKRSIQGKFYEKEPPLTRRRRSQMGDDLTGADSGLASPGAEPNDGIKQIRLKPLSNIENKVYEFSSESSLVLVGMRGAGKSTLAIMASSAMNKKVIDLETAFQSASGIPSTDYKMKHGSKECCEQQAKILKNILHRHPNGYILVCSWINDQIQSLLQEFCVSHPVILIIRDIEAIRKLFNIRDRGKAWNLLRVSSDFFRSCTNFEFSNISEKGVLPHEFSPDPTNMQKVTPCLALKRTEKHFLSFLSSIYPVGTFLFTDPAFPLAKIAVEDRQFTYAASILLSNLLESNINIENCIAGSDSIQITMDDLEKRLDEYHWRSTSIESQARKLADDLTEGLRKARRNTILPLIIHIALPEILEEHIVKLYLHLIHHTIRLAPEMITIDLRLDESFISQVLVSCKRTKVIGNCFIEADPPPWDSPVWLSWYNKANKLGCHIARLLRPASSFEDNITVGLLRSSVAAINESKIPLTAYNTGHLGRTSATFNSVLTIVEAGLSPTPTEKTKPALISSITAFQATQALCSCFVYDSLKFYVFGMQVDYSLSPAMLGAGFRACGISHDYQSFSSSSLRDVQNLIEDPHFGGASVGFPYKIEIVSLTHALSSHAEAIGAVNTIIPIRHVNLDSSIPEGADFFRFSNRSGPIKAIYGENTDWIGIRACIRKGLSPANAVTSNTCGLVIGAGGMARATIYAMLQLGIENIVIYNRTWENAKKIMSHFTELLQKKRAEFLKSDSIRFYSIKSLHEEWPTNYRLPTVIVSCIPTHRVRDKPAPDFILPEAWLESKTGGLIIDMGYKTLNTPLLAQARNWSSRGWISMDGLDILPEQGFAQFELFTGRRAPRKIMRLSVLQAYRVEDGDDGRKELQARLRLADEDPEEFVNTI